jgi:hypothetical protein
MLQVLMYFLWNSVLVQLVFVGSPVSLPVGLPTGGHPLSHGFFVILFFVAGGLGFGAVVVSLSSRTKWLH